MKKIFLSNIILVLTLIIGVTSCDSDTFEPVGGNDGPLPENVRIYHVNPRTGVDYTQEELDELDYNPFEKEVYLIDQDIEVIVKGSLQPLKLEVNGSNGLITTITDFTPVVSEEFGEEYESSKFTTTVTELGLEEGNTEGLSFVASYDVGGGSIAAVVLNFSVKYQGDISQINSGFQLVGENPADTRFLALNSNDGSDLQSFESNRMGYEYLDTQYGTVQDDDDYLDFVNEGDFSVGVWIKTTSDGRGSDPVIIGNKDWSNNENPGFIFAFEGNKWTALIADGSSKENIWVENNVNDGEWHYLTATYDRDGSMVIYEDGIEWGTRDISGIGNSISNLPIRLAQDGTGGYNPTFEGIIADAKVFDYVLSAQEVADLAEEPQFAVLVSYESGASSVLNVDLSGDVAEETFSNGKKGYSFDGIAGQYGTIVDPDGLLDFRKTDDFSVSFWVNSTSTNDDPPMLSEQDWSSGGNPGFTVAYKDTKMETNFGGSGAGHGVTTDGSSPLSDGVWHLINITFDKAGDVTMYQDGVVVGTRDMTDVGTMDSGNPINIAQDGTGGYSPFFEGKIAGIVISDYVLSAQEITDML